MLDSNKNANYINHIALVLDASDSMSGFSTELVKVADNLIAYLAQRSKELDQETRVSVYMFNNVVNCIIYDKDVLRLPSIDKHYRTWGMTALIDATIKSLDDLALTPEIYGDHSFLTYVLTDGQENHSGNRPSRLAEYLARLPEHWTVAVFVPNQNGKFEAKKFGFPADNIAIWDATTAQGVIEVGEVIRAATDSYMISRASGIRGTRSLFSTDAATLNKTTIKANNLKALTKRNYKLLDIDGSYAIRDFVESQGLPYRLGVAFYQLTKTESIQPQKNIAIKEKKTNKVFTGANARAMLGLPDMEVRVKPDFNPDYDVFVQSTSVNRKLIDGTQLLYIF